MPVTLRRYDGAVHGFFRWLAKAELSRRAVAEVGAALRAGLAVARLTVPSGASPGAARGRRDRSHVRRRSDAAELDAAAVVVAARLAPTPLVPRPGSATTCT